MQLVGGLNPSDKYWSNWINSPTCGENKKIWNHHLDLDQNRSKIYDISIGALFTKVNVHNILSKIGSVSREVSNHKTESPILFQEISSKTWYRILSYRTSKNGDPFVVFFYISCALFFSKANSRGVVGTGPKGAAADAAILGKLKPWVCCWGWRPLNRKSGCQIMNLWSSAQWHQPPANSWR